MRRRLLSTLSLILALGASLLSQTAELSVVNAGPTGEIRQLQDANEIRVVFSEPMVPLGRIPSNPTPSWIRITPEVPGTFRWSGTTILMFTADPRTPLPYATRFAVTVDADATAVSGRRLGKPYTFSFTTPTVRLTSARWMRRGGRFDAPVVLALQFNQPIRPSDIAAHVAVQYEPHEIRVPAFTAAERARMQTIDPDGFERFNDKVLAARADARRNGTVGVAVATTWDRDRFPASDHLAVLETTEVPPPGAWLRLILDTSLPSPAGPERPTSPQTSLVELPPALFVTSVSCRRECNPSAWNGIVFSEQVDASQFARSLTVADITEAPQEQPVAKRTTTTPAAGRDASHIHNVEYAGFDRQPPARTWALRLDPSLQSLDGQTLGYPWVGIIENWHERAFTSFGDGHGVWERGGGALLPFYARNFQDVTEHLAPLSLKDLIPRLVSLEQSYFDEMPPGDGRNRRLNVKPDEIQSHGVDLTSVLSPQGTGLVWAGIRPGAPIERSDPMPRTRSTVVQVTNLGITVKDSPHSTLVFVTALDTGAPVADANVTIVNTDNRTLWRGTSNRDGVALAPALPLREPDNWYRFSFVVTAEKDGDVAYVGSNWNEGILPWEFDAPFNLWEAANILRGSVFTDRGVYKPGEDVHVKAILRTDTADGIRLLPANATLQVRAYDARNKEVDRRDVRVNRWSSAEWTWRVPADATLGQYRLRVLLPEAAAKPDPDDPARNLIDERPTGDWLREVGGGFLVAAYRRPDFRVDTTLVADVPLAGAPLRASVDARYLFGSSMGARPVTWSLTRVPDFSVPAPILERYPSNQYVFGYSPDLSDPVRMAGETTSLDAGGRLALTLDTERDVDHPQRYTFEADVEDVSRQHLASRSSLVVHAAPWYIGLRRPDYFADTKTGTSVDVVAVSPDGTPAAGVPVTLSLVRVQWNSIRRAEGSGFYTWETERLEIPSGTWTVTTELTPVNVRIPVPEGGFYQLRATASDAEGRRTRTDTFFYGLGAGYTAWRRFDHNRITLEPERQTWKPGEQARIMIQSPWESATALLTVEREGIRSHRRFTLTSTQQTVTVPITEDDIPNVFVSVLLVRGRTSSDVTTDDDPGKPAFRLGYTQLHVADDTKVLKVSVTADREEYRPANKARVSVAVTDSAGRPARSEVTLWAVDYGVLSLTDYRVPDVARAVYQHKALQVLTADTRQRIISRRVLTPKGASEGGGGGSEGDVRRDFRPLAFWIGSVETDGRGRATREVTLPESLTTYRILAVAGDAASRFGSASAEIRVSKPVTLLPAFPRFLTLGDRAVFGGVVTNTLTAGGDAVVTIRSLDPDVVQFESRATDTVRLGGGSTAPVRFDAVASRVGQARVQMTVKLGDHTDAFETVLPVIASSPLVTSAAFGTTIDRAVESLTLPAGIVPDRGALAVDLSTSALVGLGEGARYLALYPYGCAEQKASAALALALAADLGRAFSMAQITPAEYRSRAEALFNELPRFQCGDGGFGSWPGCRNGQFYLTNYVLHVMRVGQSLGISSDENVVKRALNFVDQQMKEPTPQQVQWLPAWAASTAFGAKILAEYGRPQDSNITRLFQAIEHLPVFGLSYLADAMAASQSRGPRYDEVLRRLSNALRVEGNRAQVEELDTDALAWLWNSNVRSTALVLEGLVARGDQHPLVESLVRGLLAARVDGRWRNTQENAIALEALVRYYRAFETEEPDLQATVSVSGRRIGTARFRGRSAESQQVRVEMADLIKLAQATAAPELIVERTGTGRLYYTARLQYQPTSVPAETDQGIHIERRFEPFVERGSAPPSTSFAAGDLVRVTLTITLPKERRFVAVTDPLAAGFEAVEGWFATTAADLARDASVQSSDESFGMWWRRGGFDRVEKHDDRVQLFATRLSEGRHEFSYLVRATTAGTFGAAGTFAEEMYAPEVFGRGAPVTITVR